MLVCCHVVISVWLDVGSAWCTTFLGLLGNGTGHHPGSLSEKWNPVYGSQTQDHTFRLFIHSLSCGVPETEPEAAGVRE